MKKTLIAITLVVAVTTASAQTAPPASAASTTTPPPPALMPATVPAIETVPLSSEEKAYFKREAALVRSLRLLELQAQIATQQRKISGPESKAEMPVMEDSPTIISRTPIPTSRASVQAPVKIKTNRDLPFVLMAVWGIEGSYNADLSSRGLRVTVREGDKLPEGWRVSEIARTGILIKRGKSSRTVLVGG